MSSAVIAEIAYAWLALTPNLAATIPIVIRVGVIMLLFCTQGILPARRNFQPGVSGSVLSSHFAMRSLMAFSLAASAYRAMYLLKTEGVKPVSAAARLAFDLWLCWMQHRLPHSAQERPDNNGREYCPEECESFLSLATYSWVLRRLVSTDTPATPVALPAHLQVENTFTQLQKHWRDELASGRRSLAMAILRVFALDIFLVSSLCFLLSAHALAAPLVTSHLMRQLSTPDIDGAYWTLALSMIMSILGTLLQQNSIDMKDRATLRLRTALTAMVHSQALRRPGLAAVAASN
ncbi:hypothetical protein EC988_006154, partial [Linderina pennispora]